MIRIVSRYVSYANFSKYRDTYRIVTHVSRYVLYRDTYRIVTHVSRYVLYRDTYCIAIRIVSRYVLYRDTYCIAIRIVSRYVLYRDTYWAEGTVSLHPYLLLYQNASEWQSYLHFGVFSQFSLVFSRSYL